MRKQAVKSASEAADYMVVQAKGMAPRKSGETIRGIRKRPRKKGYVVESTVPGRFKQNLFANQTAPFRTINYPKGAWIGPSKSYTGRWNMIAAPGTKAVYGQSPNWNWTGTPRFFHLATLRTRSKFLQITRRNTLKALRVSL